MHDNSYFCAYSTDTKEEKKTPFKLIQIDRLFVMLLSHRCDIYKSGDNS